MAWLLLLAGLLECRPTVPKILPDCAVDREDAARRVLEAELKRCLARNAAPHPARAGIYELESYRTQLHQQCDP